MSGWGVYRRYVCREPKGMPMNQQRLLGPPTVFLKANLKVFQFLLNQTLETDLLISFPVCATSHLQYSHNNHNQLC